MYRKITKAMIALFSLFIALFCLLLAVSFSAEAGYKSGYKSSYRSSYKSSSSNRSHSTPSNNKPFASTSIPPSKLSNGNSLSTGPKIAVAGSGVAVVASSVSASEKPLGSHVGSSSSPSVKPNAGSTGGITATKSVSGAELVNKKGKIAISDNSLSKSSSTHAPAPVPGSSYARKATPSQNVVNMIADRDRRGGIGFTHLAMLYWLTSSSNSHASSLSTNDKEWIQQQIKEQESSGESREKAINELRSAGVDTSAMQIADGNHQVNQTPVVFYYDMPTTFTAGHVWMFVVSATQGENKQAPVCELKDATFITKNESLLVKWKSPPNAEGKTEMKCKAFGSEEIKSLVSI